MGSPTARASFGRARSVAHGLKEAFHKISWGVAGLSFLAGYFIPQTLAALGVGNFLANSSATYANATYSLWEGAGGASNAVNPWGNNGPVGWGKLIGIGYTSKLAYDWQKHGTIGRGKMNVGLPFALGLIMDGPELHPFTSGGVLSGPVGPGSGGVAW